MHAHHAIQRLRLAGRPQLGQQSPLHRHELTGSIELEYGRWHERPHEQRCCLEAHDRTGASSRRPCGAVLGAAIDRYVWVAAALPGDGPDKHRPRSSAERCNEGGRLRLFSAGGQAVLALPSDPGARLTGPDSWVNYPLGVLAALPVFGLRVPAGFDYLAMSDLPTGAGLSSSAAIELASGLVFLAATHQTPSRETLVNVGQYAENHFVGVPCGILDQGVSGFGRRDHLVQIDCRGPRFSTVPLPAGARFWIFNTNFF